MMIWLVLIAIVAAVSATLLAPLFRPPTSSPSRSSRELAIYRDQLAEIRRDVDGGRIAVDEAKSAEIEIQRKMLTAADAVDPAEAGAARRGSRLSRAAAAIAVALAVPAGAVTVYLWVGSPGQPAYPFDPVRATAVRQAQERVAEMTTLVDRLAERLRQEPNSLEGWALLARSYAALERRDDAARAFERAYELSGKAAGYAGDYAQALVLAANGQVASEATSLFDEVIEADPSEPRARYFLALAKAQAGQARDAIAMWRSLEVDSPPGAAWLPSVRDSIARVAADAGIDPASIPAQSTAPIRQAPGPTADDVAAAQSMSADEQQAMIRNMVEGLAQRLAANPDDLEGWKRLGKSYGVLDEPAKAQDAYARAVALAPTDLSLLTDYAEATLSASGPVTIPPESVDALRRVLETNASDPAALWLVGLAEAQSKNSAGAIPLWKRLLAQLQPDTPPYRSVQARLEALKTSP